LWTKKNGFCLEFFQVKQGRAPGSADDPDLPSEDAETETQLPESTWHPRCLPEWLNFKLFGGMEWKSY